MNQFVLRNLSYGVYIISALDGERPTGCVANSVMQITSSPATVAISVNHDNFTNSCINIHKRFAVSILSETTDSDIIGTFGFQSGKETNKFDKISYETHDQLPIVTAACGYFTCNVINQVETSTHTIFIGKIVDGELLDSNSPMTYAYYHQVIRGKSPKNAPTYIPEEETTKTASVYRCGVCGYVYDGEIPFEELSDSYTCPICMAPKNKFVQMS